MEPFVSNSFRGVQYSEVLGSNRSYGDRFETNDAPGSATSGGTVPVGVTLVGDTLSIDGDIDEDYFSFSVAEPLTLTLSVAPRGESYTFSAQNNSTGSCDQTPTTVNTTQTLDLRLDLRDGTNTTTLASSNFTGAGGIEVITYSFGPGNYLLLVSQHNDPSQGVNSVDDVQLYDIEIAAPTALPVEWLDFEARASGALTHRLDWRTLTESHSSYYDVERSTDGKHFERIDRVAAAGHTTEVTAYEYTDRVPHHGIWYYRLLQIDDDGHTAYSEIVSVTSRAATASLQAYPVPATRQVIIDHPALQAGSTLQLQTYDVAGKLLPSLPYTRSEGRLQLDVQALPHGTYVTQMQLAGVAYVVRWVRG